MEKVNGTLEDAGIKAISKRQLYADIDFMKSRDGWARGGKPANNASEFNALPAGAVLFGEFAELGSSTYFWVAEGGGDHGAVYWNLINATDQISTAEDFDVSAFSLRCVKNKVLQK